MISIAILTKNSQETIQKVLESTLSFNEVVLLDSGSTDETLSIAAKFPNVKIFFSPFLGFGPMRNKLAALALHDWILALDSDEVLSKELQEEISEATLRENTLYEIPFLNFLNGKKINCCGWQNEKHIRLYNRKTTFFSNLSVHEGIQKNDLPVHTFRNPIFHYPYRSMNDFLKKMDLYSSLFASENAHKKKSSFSIALGHCIFAFCKCYLWKKGIFGGKEGLFISLYNAQTTFYKYLKLAEANQKSQCL
ncbi:MAG: glycosyltransferase family 2 protein [Chlamydiota bacterium]